MKLLRLWPQRLVGQVTLVLMLAVALEFIGSSLLFEHSRLYPDRESQTRRVAEQLITAEALLEEASPDERAARAAVMSNRVTQLSWSILPSLVDGGRDVEDEFREEFLEAEPGLRGRDLRLRANIDHALPRDTHLKAALKLRDGS
ncbi:hypothetical protein [Caulobacter segnis]|uniref:hypothetical protein n=1 Tax=Caulobacter segnis TaxID=88688 RepID=UPI001CBACE7F|nr:hypothetical protein [Caulobacter segnis]UAL12359.1 hypothetical protein K8940_08780 [Caulobacter segnis]